MTTYFYREHLINTSQQDSVVSDAENKQRYTVNLFYNSKWQRFLTQGLGALMNGSTSVFNITVKSSETGENYSFYQQPLHKNLIGTKWDVYHNGDTIGLLKTKLDVSKDTMWLELGEEQSIVFESVKLSAKTYGYARGEMVAEVHSERFSPVSKHEIEISSKEHDDMLLLGVFQTFFTFLELSR